MRKTVISIVVFIGIATGAFAASPTSHASAADAIAMLERAIAALKAGPEEALGAFNRADGGFRDRDLYVACFDARTGIVQAHIDPKQLGRDIRTVKQPDGTPFGQKLFDAAKAGTITAVDYEYPMPGSAAPVAKESYVTRVGNEGCLVGYYK